MCVKGLGVKKNYKVAIQWFRLAAKNGLADAETNLGDMYQNGWGVAKDRVEAIAWYLKAADHGNEHAKKKLKALGIAY